MTKVVGERGTSIVIILYSIGLAITDFSVVVLGHFDVLIKGDIAQLVEFAAPSAS